MSDLYGMFEDRLGEVETYIDFLQSLEESATGGRPKLENYEHAISPHQQKILYSTVYIQLYNLVEATITLCVEAVVKAIVQGSSYQVSSLTEALRSEWIRGIARTNVELNYHNRFQAAIKLYDHLLEQLPITDFVIEKGGGGNWDVDAIEKIIQRIGFSSNVSPAVYQSVKRPIRNGKGSLELVKKMRNDLAHGSISFVECANEVSVSELRILKDNTVNYLKEIVDNFASYIEGFEYLIPEERPEESSG